MGLFVIIALLMVTVFTLGVTMDWLDGRRLDRQRQRRQQELEPPPKTQAEITRELELELGIGPFRGREGYCDLTKCKGRHLHTDIDPVTKTGKPPAY